MSVFLGSLEPSTHLGWRKGEMLAHFDPSPMVADANDMEGEWGLHTLTVLSDQENRNPRYSGSALRKNTEMKEEARAERGAGITASSLD